MGWESRDGRGRYYTRSRREGGRVVREYVGTGPGVEAIARLDALDRERRADDRAAWMRERARLDDLAAPVLALDALGEALADAALLATGYHRHHRGTWRKRRHDEDTEAPPAGADGG
jgi:hypothetical protein